MTGGQVLEVKLRKCSKNYFPFEEEAEYLWVAIGADGVSLARCHYASRSSMFCVSLIA
jgi:uncharacterized lipoprotein NlpE involved in copper resistance